MVRVYLPYDLQALQEIIFVARLDDGDPDECWIPEFPGHAVTAALKNALPELDEEGLEHYAMTEAAQESLALIGKDPGRNRRLVMAVEVPTAVPRLGHPTSVQLERVAIPTDVVAWLVDTDDAVPAVTAAAVAIRLGEDDADELAERCLDHELAWYSAPELDVVLQLS